MDVRLLFPSLYVAAPDLRGKDRTLTIRRVIVDELRTQQGVEKKPVVYFEETLKAAKKAGTPDKEKRLVLNKTNAMTIAELYDFEVDNWQGKRITLYPTKAEAFGKTVDCIRVRDTIPADEPKPAPAAAEGGDA